MSGPVGVMTVILLEAAAGGAVVLWASGVWGVVRRGFFALTGVSLMLCALGAWLLARGALPGGPAVTALAAFAAGLALWQGLLLARQEAASRVVGLAAAAAGVVALVAFAGVRSDAARALAELALGALFLGSTLFGLLLGHWYLVERRLTNACMVRSCRWYVAGVVAAAGAVWLSAANPAPAAQTSFSPFLALPNFTVMLAGGLVGICALIAGFVWKLAQEGGRSIQAATGMFYLAVIMAFSAEMSAKFRFFS